MKIHHLIGGISIAITNEERNFIKSHESDIPLAALDEHGIWIAQNLVRKNVYRLTMDNRTLMINNGHEIIKTIT